LSMIDRLTIAIEMSIKNSTLGLTIALTLMNSPEMATPIAVYGLLMYPIVGLLVFYGRKLNE
jgi:bile acid:Na+ symporter, BASS family